MANDRSSADFNETPLDLQHSRQDHAAIVTLRGSCSMICAERLGSLLVQLAESDAQVVVLDLRELEFIESTSLGKVVAAYLKLRRRGADMRLVGPNAEIRNLLKLTRLDHLFPIAESVEAALKTP